MGLDTTVMKPTFQLLVAFLLTLSTGTFAQASDGPARLKPRPVAALPAKQAAVPVNVPAGQSGRVWEVYVKNGQHVQQGQTMFKIATQVRTAGHPGHQIDYDVARQQYVKVLALHKANKASAAEVADAKFRLQTAGKVLNDSPQQLLFHYVDAPTSGTLSSVSATGQLQANSRVAVITADAPATKVKTKTKLIAVE